MQKYKVSAELLNFDLKKFLTKFSGYDSAELSLKLKRSWVENFDFTWLAQQLKLYKKCKHKIPAFASAFCWLTTKSFEQASGQLSAFYKSSLFKGNKFLSLCGGLGVDDWAFSQTFKQVISVDLDEELNKLVRHNFKKLGIDNFERITFSAEDFLKTAKGNFDLIYIDADRRPDSEKKSFRFEDCSPNVLDILHRMFELTETILLKLSPLIDIEFCKKNLLNVAEIHVISVENEVKEVLCSLKKRHSNKPVLVKAVDILSQNERLVFTSIVQKQNLFENKGIYFIEPSLSIIKAALVADYAQSINAKMVAKNSNYLLTDELKPEIMGRSFKIISVLPFNKKVLKKYFDANSITKANVSKRNFPLQVDEIRKQLKLKDGGEEYLFFTTNERKEKVVYLCRKLASGK